MAQEEYHHRLSLVTDQGKHSVNLSKEEFDDFRKAAEKWWPTSELDFVYKTEAIQLKLSRIDLYGCRLSSPTEFSIFTINTEVRVQEP